MAATARRQRFEHSLDMGAVRPELCIKVSSPVVDNAWSMVDSPVLGRTSSVSRRPTEIATSSFAPLRCSTKPRPVAPLNIKKIRRRGLLSGVHLVLPPSPLSPPTPGLTPQTSLTFTAEWDSTQEEFMFTPLENELPTSALSPHAPTSPVPEDFDGELDMTPSSTAPCPGSPCSSTSSGSSHPDSLFTHERKQSVSTCPTTALDDPAKPSTSSASLPPHISLRLFQGEMQRVTAVAESEAFDKTCLEGMDEDLLLHPWSAFDTLCWESVTELADSLDALRLPRMLATNSKSLPDVPSDSRSVKSIVDFTGADEAKDSRFSNDAPLLAASKSKPHRCVPLHFRSLSKVFKGGFHRH
ncbi:hypothetical protein AcW1_003817 [Taiwanofungus camphoratus]|nr:hypothetical protein AcW1_003817 [Antrodia cinnamomea]